jgi:hypothetical protein
LRCLAANLILPFLTPVTRIASSISFLNILGLIIKKNVSFRHQSYSSGQNRRNTLAGFGAKPG